MIAQHSSATQEHPTPEIVVEPARRLLGGFDLDPASTPEFNQRIGAARIFTQADDGLAQPWHGRVWLNPPGGRRTAAEDRWLAQSGAKTDSTAAAWWDKLVTEWIIGHVTEAFFVGFTLEIMRTSQSCAAPVQAFHRCYPKKRLAFNGDQPTHANVLVYLPRHGSQLMALERMREQFGELGLCEPGYVA